MDSSKNSSTSVIGKPSLKTSQKSEPLDAISSPIDNATDTKVSVADNKSQTKDLDLVEVQINAPKFVETLRHSTISNIAAVEDIIDNCIDAGASVVHITTRWNPKSKVKSNKEETGNGPKTIVISDNGSGMDLKELKECLRLGADSGKDSESDIGCFGVGLKTAALSFCTRFKVVTRKNGVLNTGIFDLKNIHKYGKMMMEIGEADFLDQCLFREELEKLDNVSKNIEVKSDSTGTVIVLEKIDRFKWKNEKSFIDKLTVFSNPQTRYPDQSLDEVYRVYLNSSVLSIAVNGVSVKAFDPVRDLPLNSELQHESFDFNGETINLTIAEINTSGEDSSRQMGIGFYSKGFYVLRNDRQILKANELGCFSNRNNINNIRIEMKVPASLDGALQVSSQKDNMNIGDDFRSKLKTVMSPHFRRFVANNAIASRVKKLEKELDTSSAEKKISQNNHLLRAIKGLKKEKRNPKKNKSDKKRQDPTKSIDRKNVKRTQPVFKGHEKVKFDRQPLGRKAPIWFPIATDTNKINIVLNIDHPFYDYIISLGKEDDRNPILYLIYCMSREEVDQFDATNEATAEVLENVRHQVGISMATLLSV